MRAGRMRLLLPVVLAAMAFAGALGQAAAADLRAVQQALTARGYDAGFADGVYGPQTARAIRAFEAAHGWPETGGVSDRLIRALQPPRVLPPIVLRPPSSVLARQGHPARQEAVFANRNWLIRDAPQDGVPASPAFALFLEADGKVAGPRYAERMRWRGVDGLLLIRYESAIGAVVERTGRPLDADRITGEAHGPDGAVWLWTAEAKPQE